MKTFLLTSLVVLGGWGSLTHIRDRNAAVQRAEAAYARGNFRLAAAAYRKAVEQPGAADEALVLNLAHACLRAGQRAEARSCYGRLLTSRTSSTRSIARQQLAVLAAQQGDYARAVSLLRQALLADPTNTAARYNYEALKSYLDRQQREPRIPPPAPAGAEANEPRPTTPENPANQPRSRAGNDRTGQLDNPAQPENPLNTPQARPDQQGQRDPGQSAASAGRGAAGFQPGQGSQQKVAIGSEPGSVRGLSEAAEGVEDGTRRQPGAQPASLSETQLQTQRERLQQMNLSSGQARRLLETLNAAEQQYLQQLPHKSSRQPDPKKPAW
ncbi:hypothetical protein GCM10022408_04810 [Hymenobacter fastidiosus]|uniref:Tetratricopeptide repeat protein n=1 Tax=Hymenobacter fastidiosus TaxID=486264 RepID=A0ABP7RGL0_9BACT